MMDIGEISTCNKMAHAFYPKPLAAAVTTCIYTTYTGWTSISWNMYIGCAACNIASFHSNRDLLRHMRSKRHICKLYGVAPGDLKKAIINILVLHALTGE
jgi:hypothetical protein